MILESGIHQAATLGDNLKIAAGNIAARPELIDTSPETLSTVGRVALSIGIFYLVVRGLFKLDEVLQERKSLKESKKK